MADEFEEGAKSSSGKMPTWIWLAAGGGLILILLLKGGSKQSTTATDNLLAAEIDANLKAMGENIDTQMKQYKDDQKIAWDDFKMSIEDLLRERQGTSTPSDNVKVNPKDNPSSAGSEELGYIPDTIHGSVMDNYIMGFNYQMAKGGKQ